MIPLLIAMLRMILAVRSGGVEKAEIQGRMVQRLE